MIFYMREGGKTSYKKFSLPLALSLHFKKFKAEKWQSTIKSDRSPDLP